MKLHLGVLALMAIFTARVTLADASAVEASSVGCVNNPPKQRQRSEELQSLAKGDQDDRKLPVESIDWQKVRPRDEARRKRVGEIFGEGCVTSAADYSAAALIYQHGDVADHFFQSFLWSKKAFEMGNSSEGHSVANGIDRYLVSLGHKQLFGTQFSQDPASKQWCIEPIEKSFPESRRTQYLKTNLQGSIASFLNFYKSKQLPTAVQDCDHNLQPSPAGIAPGLW
jgi:hypothetical protein